MVEGARLKWSVFKYLKNACLKKISGLATPLLEDTKFVSLCTYVTSKLKLSWPVKMKQCPLPYQRIFAHVSCAVLIKYFLAIDNRINGNLIARKSTPTQ